MGPTAVVEEADCFRAAGLAAGGGGGVANEGGGDLVEQAMAELVRGGHGLAHVRIHSRMAARPPRRGAEEARRTAALLP